MPPPCIQQGWRKRFKVAGYLTWTSRVLREPPILAGYPLAEGLFTLATSEPTAGLGIDMLGGGAVYQRTPAHRFAPLDLAPEVFALNVQTTHEGDYFRLRRLRSLAQAEPVPCFLEDPREDMWIVPPDAQTEWTLSRSLPFGTVPFAQYRPRAWLVDLPQQFDETELSVVTAGPPSEDQVVVDPTTDAEIIETADLSTHAGRALVLRYHPLRWVTVEAVSRSIETPNGLDFEITLREHVPARDYRGPA